MLPSVAYIPLKQQLLRLNHLYRQLSELLCLETQAGLPLSHLLPQPRQVLANPHLLSKRSRLQAPHMHHNPDPSLLIHRTPLSLKQSLVNLRLVVCSSRQTLAINLPSLFSSSGCLS